MVVVVDYEDEATLVERVKVVRDMKVAALRAGAHEVEIVPALRLAAQPVDGYAWQTPDARKALRQVLSQTTTLKITLPTNVVQALVDECDELRAKDLARALNLPPLPHSQDEIDEARS